MTVVENVMLRWSQAEWVLKRAVGPYVVQMAAYLIALGVLAGLGRASRMPAVIGQPPGTSEARNGGNHRRICRRGGLNR